MFSLEVTMVKVVILNDTTRDEGHIGCRLVMENMRKLCRENGWNVLFCDQNGRNGFSKKEFQAAITPADIVLLNGEGTLHDDAGSVWLQKAEIAKENHKKVCLLNATWQNNPQNKRYLSCFDLLSFRDEKSLREAERDGAENIFCTPDLSFYSFNKLRRIEHTAVRDMLCIDSTLKSVTAALIKYAYKNDCDICFMYEKKRKAWASKLVCRWQNFWSRRHFELLSSAERIARYQKIVSGRYHACCLAFMMNIPTLGIGSNTWKTEALYQEAGLTEFFLPEISKNLNERILSFAGLSPEAWQEKCFEYSSQAQRKIKFLFRLLEHI